VSRLHSIFLRTKIIVCAVTFISSLACSAHSMRDPFEKPVVKHQINKRKIALMATLVADDGNYALFGLDTDERVVKMGEIVNGAMEVVSIVRGAVELKDEKGQKVLLNIE
jgi:hypothetical protein